MEGKLEEKNLTLTEFLNYFDFDYVVYDDNFIGLIDNQSANLGNIEEERYTNDAEGVLNIVNRLDTYYNDYIFIPLQEVLEEKHNIDTDKMSWKEVYEIVKALKLDYDMDILPYVFSEKEVVLDSEMKGIEEGCQYAGQQF